MNQRRDGRYDATNPKTAAMLSKTKPFANSVVSWVTGVYVVLTHRMSDTEAEPRHCDGEEQGKNGFAELYISPGGFVGVEFRFIEFQQLCARCLYCLTAKKEC